MGEQTAKSSPATGTIGSLLVYASCASAGAVTDSWSNAVAYCPETRQFSEYAKHDHIAAVLTN